MIQRMVLLTIFALERQNKSEQGRLYHRGIDKEGKSDFGYTTNLTINLITLFA